MFMFVTSKFLRVRAVFEFLMLISKKFQKVFRTIPPEKFAQILRLQVSDAEKRARADHVINTGVTLAQTRAEVAALVKSIREKNRR